MAPAGQGGPGGPGHAQCFLPQFSFVRASIKFRVEGSSCGQRLIQCVGALTKARDTSSAGHTRASFVQRVSVLSICVSFCRSGSWQGAMSVQDHRGYRGRLWHGSSWRRHLASGQGQQELTQWATHARRLGGVHVLPASPSPTHAWHLCCTCAEDPPLVKVETQWTRVFAAFLVYRRFVLSTDVWVPFPVSWQHRKLK